MNGDVVEFHRAAKIILAAAQNKPIASNVNVAATYKSRRSVTVKFTREELPLPSTKQRDVLSNTMDNIQTLMNKDRMDAVLLGMESLALLVDGSSSKEETMISTSKAILCNGGIWQDVKDMLFGLVMDRNVHIDEEVTNNTGYDCKFRLAMKILGNALACVCQHQKGSGSDFDIDMDEMKDLLSTLKEYSKERLTSPDTNSNHDHVDAIRQATRCIDFLVGLSAKR